MERGRELRQGRLAGRRHLVVTQDPVWCQHPHHRSTRRPATGPRLLLHGPRAAGLPADRSAALVLVASRGCQVASAHHSTDTAVSTRLRDLASVSGGVLIYLVAMGNAHCLEGIHEAWLDGERLQLSSGFEDYFISAQYFDVGDFHSPLSGLTHESTLLEPRRLSAYILHTADPVTFAHSLRLRWRNGMHATAPLAARNTTVRGSVWMYRW
mmetsp:Transcript_78403/g.235021  ORF Transcript_78403/g.235021 Transcript_78403/m.235021 type:complete len:211 (-) Transcript_78403:87-719(-)